MKKVLKKYLLSITILVAFALMLTPSHTLAQDAVACESDVVVQADDWLSKIADKVYGDLLAYPAIVEATNAAAASDDSYATIDNPDLIEPGWKLCIPAAADAEAILGTAIEVTEDERGILRIPHDFTFGGKENMDPVDSSRFFPIISMTYDRLAAPGPDGRPAPSLATSWETNDDATVWTLKIREGVEFHDGAPLTSADVAYSIDHWRGSETSLLATTLELIDSVDTPDDHTVVINLSQPHTDFPLLLQDYRARIIPKDGLEEVLTTGRGTGPFILEKLDPEGTTILVANDNYWAGPPGLAGAEVTAIPDIEAKVQALLAGQIDYWDLALQQSQLFEGNPDYTIEQIVTGNWSGIVMNTSKAPFDNLPLRQAMRLVADRQAMVELALGGAGVVACDTPVMSTDQYRFDTDCSQDIDRAKDLLVEAGYADGFEITMYTADVCADLLSLAEVYQQQAALAGINIDIQQVPTDGYWTAPWMVENFVMTCWGERPADQILNEAYRSGGAWNESYWNSESYDALLDQARGSLDFEQRRDYYQAAQEVLWDEGGTLIPYHRTAMRVKKACLTDVDSITWLNIDWSRAQKPASCQ